MFSKRPYYKWLVITLISSVVLSIVVVVLYNLDILKTESTNGDLILDMTPATNNATLESKEGTPGGVTTDKKWNSFEKKTWHHPMIQNRSPVPSLHGHSFFLEISQKFANALDLLDSHMKNDLIVVHLKQAIKDAFSRVFEILYKDERIILMVKTMKTEEALAALETWREKFLSKITPEFVDKLRTSFPNLKTAYKNIYRYFLLLTFEFKSLPIPKGEVENIKKAQEYIFQRYILDLKDTELLEDSACNAMVELLANPQAKECLVHVFGSTKPNTIKFLTSKPEKGALIAWLDKKLTMISGVPLLLIIQTLLEEPLVENMTTVTSLASRDPFYDVIKGLIFRLVSFVYTLEQQQQQRKAGELISGDVAFMKKDFKKSSGYIKAALRNFFEDLPKHREELEALMGVRQARDTLLCIMKWSRADEVYGVYTHPATTPFEIVEGVGRSIVFMEHNFGISLGVFYKALYRVSYSPSN